MCCAMQRTPVRWRAECDTSFGQQSGMVQQAVSSQSIWSYCQYRHRRLISTLQTQAMFMTVQLSFINYDLNFWPPLWSGGQSSWLQNGDLLCFLWGTNWIYICYVEESRPPLWSSGQSSWLQNGVLLCFLWGTNWIYICYVEESRPPLWSSGQSYWLQIQRSRFDSRRYQIFWEVVGLERGPLSLVATVELLERKSSGSEIIAVGIHHAYQVTPSIRKSWH
jgi:hypothetical protein